MPSVRTASSAGHRAASGRRSWPQRLAWVGVLASGVGSYLVVLRVLTASDNMTLFPSLLLLGAATTPITVLVFAWGSGPQIAASPGVVAFTTLAGGVVGTVAAGALEYHALQRLGTWPMLGVAIIEEAAKLIVPVALLLFLPGSRRQAGVVIGIASGMGFATLETMGYAFNAMMTAGSVSTVDQTLLLRGLLAPAGHVAWTGITVAALWRLPGAERKTRAGLVAVGAFALAVTLHTCWDASSIVAVHVAVGSLSFGLLLFLIERSQRAPQPTRGR